MKKNKYISPEIQVVEMELENHVLGGSMVGSVDGKPGIGWGGTDMDGCLDPQSRKFNDNIFGSSFESSNDRTGYWY